MTDALWNMSKRCVIEVFNEDLDNDGDIGRMARKGVSKETKRMIAERVHRYLQKAQGLADAG